MRGRVYTITAAMILAVGCRSGAPSTPAAGPPAPILQAHAFDCYGGPRFVMALVAGSEGSRESIDLILPDRRHRLTRIPSGSGARYVHGGVSVWNKGREAILNLDGRVYMCREASGNLRATSAAQPRS